MLLLRPSLLSRAWRAASSASRASGSACDIWRRSCYCPPAAHSPGRYSRRVGRGSPSSVDHHGGVHGEPWRCALELHFSPASGRSSWLMKSMRVMSILRQFLRRQWRAAARKVVGPAENATGHEDCRWQHAEHARADGCDGASARLPRGRAVDRSSQALPSSGTCVPQCRTPAAQAQCHVAAQML